MSAVHVSQDVSKSVQEPELGAGSFASFYELHRDGLVRAVGVSIGDRDLAVEAVDEALARAYGKWGSIAAGSNPRA